jgi:hypothetical protein
MAERADVKIRKQAIDLWKKTVSQLDEISKTLMKTSRLEKLKIDRAKLLADRDKLLKRLGQETYKLIEQGRLKVPKPLKELYNRISKLLDRIIPEKMKPVKKKPKKKAAPKPAAKKKPAKKKATKKKTTKKKTAKK